jgi:glucose/arabinose dehydrogenase
VDTAHRRLWSVSLTTGGTRVEAEDLAVGIPPGSAPPRRAPALFAHGMPGVAPRFAGLTTAPDGSLLLSSNGDGTVVRLSPARTGT